MEISKKGFEFVARLISVFWWMGKRWAECRMFEAMDLPFVDFSQVN